MVVRETFLPRLPEFSVASGKYFVWQKEGRSFESLAAHAGGTYNLTGYGEPARLVGMRMTANALPTLRVQPALGRNFTAEEDTPGKETVAILSHGLWQRQFGGRPDVLGQRIQLDGRTFTIIGVMPARSPLPETTEIVTPIAFNNDDRQNFGGHSTSVYGRLAPGVTLEQARSELTALNERIGQQNPSGKGWGIKMMPALEAIVGEVQPVLISLLGAVGLLLLIACANVANLLLARATARSREIAVRAALGAGRGRIIRQLLVESVLLGVLGGAVGILVAEGGLAALMAFAPPSLPRASEVAVDGRAFAFAAALALLTGVAFGLAPALQATRMDLNNTLKESGRSAGASGGKHRLRATLVVVELAVALVLLAGAGLLMRSFTRLANVSPGFRPEGAVVTTASLPRAKYETPPQQAAFATEAVRQLATIPGVRAVGLAQRLPFAGGQEHRGFTIQGRPPATVAEMAITNHYTVSGDYFAAMGIPLLRGRVFDSRDGEKTPRVALINASIARKFFPGEDPIGKRLNITNGPDTWREIVGVVGDIKNRSLDAEVTLQTYEPFTQQPSRSVAAVLRADGPPPGLATVAAALHSIDPDLPVMRVRPLSEVVAESIARQRFAMLLFAVFSGTAVVLACIGIYGVMAYSVSQRTGEIGIRMALGAQPADILRLVLRQGGRLIALGLGAGLAGALVLTRFLESMLFGVSTYDPPTFAAIAVLLGLVAVLACALPARRATKVTPMSALRAE
jgi:putative ABC transport system permease protein